MILFSNILLVVVASALFVPALVLFIECFMALLPGRASASVSEAPRPSIAVLVPAHNEERTVEATLRCLAPQLAPGDRLIVIADNCTDRTAEVSRGAGAVVIERRDPHRRGKGHALNYGLQFLARNPPEVVVIVDADNMVSPDAVGQIACRAMALGRPVQPRSLSAPPSNPDSLTIVSAFAFTVKNVARPSGLHRLGLPCGLMGGGMAFPWSVMEKASFAGGNLVEDLQLGVDLALAGNPPVFFFEAAFTDLLPRRRNAALSQRRRWEHGHLATLIIQGPRLLVGALRQRRLGLLALGLDLLVPPLSLLVIVGTLALCAAVLAGALGASWIPAGLLALGGGLVGAAIAGAWAKFGRTRYPVTALLAGPLYALWKLPLYWGFLVRRERTWVRAERENGP
ncbi:MAG: glycosyltransferase family 2 protein [Nitrospinota bacterium]